MISFPLSEDSKQYLRSFQGIFPDSSQAEQYLFDSWERMQLVLRWLQQLAERGVKSVLELGANPYYLTLLMRKYFDFDLQLANFFGDSSKNGQAMQTAESGSERHEFPYHHFNLEVDRYPYEDAIFDCVIFCEILEHLLLNPDFAISEQRRILRPGGYLILTTPNSARLANLVRLIRGKNVADGYSPHGIYGRHNREFTFPEVVDLLKRHSFDIMESQVRNIYPHPLKSRFVQSMRPNVWFEHIFVLARKPEGN